MIAHRSEWDDRFAVEAARIQAALGSAARRIEHVGSTAVAGLASKPIVDNMVTVDDPEDEGAYLRHLERAGYQLRVRESGHRMFRTPEQDVHLHIWRAGGHDEDRHLVFRDWLRCDPADRVRYEARKQELAGRHRDTNDYSDAKGDIIGEILERARSSRRRADTPDG